MQRSMDVKQAAREMWGLGDYDAMMRQEGLYEVGRLVVDRVGIANRDQVADIACGTGNAAIPAAQAGAQVTGLDLSPEMLRVAHRRAREAGVAVEWVEGDAEQLPFDEARFDVVLSTFGVMFTPRHAMVADEIARVLRPGGRLGLAAWTPEGVIGEFFDIVGNYLPAPPEFVDPPLSWGDEAYVRELFEGTGVQLDVERAIADIGHPSAAAAVELYTTTLGPVIQARELAEAEGRWPELDRELTHLFERANASGGGGVVLPAEYLIVSGRRRS